MRDLDASRIERNMSVNTEDAEFYVNGEESAALLKTHLLELHKRLLDQIEQAKLLANNSAAYMDSFMQILSSAYHDQRSTKRAKKKSTTGKSLCSKGKKRRKTS
nr:expressed protein [Hymenolepis microstoma]